MTHPVSASEQLARKLADYEARLAKLEKGTAASQLAHSSLEDGAIPVYDADGKLRQIFGRQPDGTFAVTYAEGDPPPAPTAPVVAARQLAVVVGWDGTFVDGVPKPGDFARVDVHMHTEPDFTPDGTTMYGSLIGEGAVAIPTDYETHYVRLVAVTLADVPSEPTAAVAVEPLPASAIASEWVYAGDILAEQIKSGVLDADLVLGSRITTSLEGAGVQMSPDGITAFDADGNPSVMIPTDPAQNAVFRGDVDAGGLIVRGAAAFRSTDSEISNGAVLTLQSATTPPQTPPMAYSSWETSVPTDIGWGYGFVWDGETFCVGYAGRIIREGHGEIVLANDRPVLGLTKIGSSWYTAEWVGSYTTQNNIWRIVRYDDTGAALAAVDYIAMNRYTGAPAPMALGTDGMNLLIAEFDPGRGHFRIQTFNATSLAHTSTIWTSGFSESGFRGPVVGVARGTFDFGVERTVILSQGGAYFYTFDSGHVYRSDTIFEPPAPGSMAGFTWDGERFWSTRVTNSEGLPPNRQIFKHTTAQWSGYNVTWHAAATWRDTNTEGGVHETALGAIGSFKPKKRAQLTLSSAAIPPSPPGTDIPNAVAFYLSTTDQQRTSFFQQRLPADGETYLTLGDTSDYQATINPPAESNFPTSEPGVIRSADGGLIISGDGTIKARSLTLPGCLATKTANQVIPNRSDTRITGWTVDFNDSGMLNPTTGVVTIIEDGVYEFEFKGTFGAGVVPIDPAGDEPPMRLIYVTRTNPIPSATGTMGSDIELPIRNPNVGFPMIARGKRRFVAGQTLHPVVWHNQSHDVDFNGSLLAGALSWYVQKTRD